MSIGRTSSAVKARYAAKVYKRIAVNLRKELAARWDEYLKQTGQTRAGFVRKAILDELEAYEQEEQ